jgi:hypothetical protein
VYFENQKIKNILKKYQNFKNFKNKKNKKNIP